jgi:hypothetical protein
MLSLPPSLLFSIGFVVLLVIRDQVGEVTIVRRNKIDGSGAAPPVEVW